MDEPKRWWNVWVAPGLEAGLIGWLGLLGWALHRPLLFASLGPTAYELVEAPDRESARPYNILMGHAIGVAVAFAVLWVTGAWRAPGVSVAGVPLVRVGASVLAALGTVLATTLAKAAQPAAVSTTLLIATGGMQQGRDAVLIMVSVCLLTLVGEPLRRMRVRLQAKAVVAGA